MRKTLLKSLLVATAMVTGANSAWAQTSTLLEYGTSDVAWSAENLTEWTAGGNPTIKDGYVEISGGNGSYATSKTIEPTANAIINVQAVWRGSSNTGRDFSAGNGSYFRFGNIIVAQNDQDKKHGYGFAGLDNIGSITTFTAGSYRTDIANCTWLLIDMEINTASNTLTSFTIKSEDGTNTYVSQSNVSLSEADYTTVAFGYRKAGRVSTTNTEDLKSVKITQTVQEVQTADYTVKYVCDDVEVKDAAVRTGVVGDNIVLNASDTENFYANDKKYIYVSSDVEGKTVTKQGTVVTVTFREAAVYNWTAKSSVGNYTISGTAFEGDKASVKYPLYVLVDGKLWTKAATDQVFAQSFDVTEDNQELTLTYSATDIENVVFLAEVEDIEGMSVVNTGNAEARSSQRAAGYSAEGKTAITSLPAGKYTMTARFYSPTSNGGNYYFYTGNRQIFNQKTDNSNASDATSQAFVLAKNGNEILLGQGGNTAAVDFIYIQTVGTPTEGELALAAAADDLADAIAEAKAIDTTEKLGADELTNAIATAETALAAADATEASLTEAQTALEEAVAAFEVANTPKYYIVGNMNEWTADENYLMVLNEAAETTEYTLTLDMTKNDNFKVIGVLGETTTWYPDGENNNYEITSDGSYTVYFRPNGDGGEGWHYSCIYAAKNHTYTVAGTVAENDTNMFGTAWDVTNTKNDMTKNDDGTYSITYTNVALTENVQYKVVVDRDWEVAYPEENRVIGISMAGKYNVTIHFNPSTKEVYETMAIYKNITDAGYATFYAPYDLNFEGSGVTAYVAKQDGNNITFEGVTSVPAYTGLLLKADEGSYPIAMKQSQNTFENNALTGVLKDTEVPAGSFVLMKGENGVGFYRTANAFTVGANTAYISALADSSRMFIGFDGEATAIDGLAGEKTVGGEIYNLQGQRVTKAQKGLYIIDGKKVMVK